MDQRTTKVPFTGSLLEAEQYAKDILYSRCFHTHDCCGCRFVQQVKVVPRRQRRHYWLEVTTDVNV